MAPISNERPGEAAIPTVELSVGAADGCERAAFIPLDKAACETFRRAVSSRPPVADSLFSHPKPTFGCRSAWSEAAEP
jgi:hypothetical protein